MKISVIIPTFNRAGLLKRALQSVLKQSLPVDEIIVVDDGSEDGTAELVRKSFPQIQYLCQPNHGVSAARNAGIRKAKSDWIALLDSDDEWLPRKIEKQVEALQSIPSFRLCHTDEIWIRNGRRVNPMKKHRKYGGDIFEHCLPLCVISPSSVMIHKSIFKKYGTFDEQLPVCEDYDMWLRICAFEPVLFLNEKLIIKYGGHDDQLSHTFWGMDRFRIQALEKIIAHPQLTEEKKRIATAMLRRKLEIYINGAEKRNKKDEAARYRKKLDQLPER